MKFSQTGLIVEYLFQTVRDISLLVTKIQYLFAKVMRSSLYSFSLLKCGIPLEQCGGFSLYDNFNFVLIWDSMLFFVLLVTEILVLV